MSAAIQEEAQTPDATAATVLGDKTADLKSGETKEAKAPKDVKAPKEPSAKTTDKEDAKGAEEIDAEDVDVPGKFDVSKFEVPEGAEIDEKWMNEFVGNESIKKLNQADAQGLIGMLGEFVTDIENKRVTAHNLEVKEWSDQLLKDEYVVKKGGLDAIKPLAIAARNEFFPEMSDLFNKTGLGAHPTMVVGFARIAEALSLLESNLTGGGRAPGGGGKENAAHKLFPDHAPGGKYDR